MYDCSPAIAKLVENKHLEEMQTAIQSKNDQINQLQSTLSAKQSQYEDLEKQLEVVNHSLCVIATIPQNNATVERQLC